MTVAWSADGRTLFAAGSVLGATLALVRVLAWSDAGAGKRRSLPAAQDTVMSLVPLPDGICSWRPRTPGSADCGRTAHPPGRMRLTKPISASTG